VVRKVRCNIERKIVFLYAMLAIHLLPFALKAQRDKANPEVYMSVVALRIQGGVKH